MKNLIFNVTRLAIRFIYSLPGRTRRLRRVLLDWGRMARMQSVARERLKMLQMFREGEEKRGNPRRKVSQGKDSNQIRPPFR